MALGQQEGEGRLVAQGGVDSFGVVEPQVVGEPMQEFLGLADHILMHLDELFGEGALVALPGLSGQDRQYNR